MADEKSGADQHRRKVLRAALWGGGLGGLGALGGIAARKTAGDPPAARKPPLGPEFSYDVSRFQASDPELVQWHEVTRFDAGFERPRNLALAPGGDLLVCGDGGVRRFDAGGGELGFVAIDGPVHAVAGLADGGLLAGRPDGVERIGPDGGLAAVWELDGVLPVSLAVAEGRVYLADAGGRVVRVLDHDGRTLGVIGERDPDRGVEGFVVPSPYFCVRLAADGLLRIANPGKHRIGAWTQDGTLELSWGRPSYAVDGFCGCCNPVSFALLPDGGYVTGEKGLPRVKTYDDRGDFTGIVAGPGDFPDYLKAAQAGRPKAASAGIYVEADAAGRVFVLDSLGGTLRVMRRKEESDG